MLCIVCPRKACTGNAHQHNSRPSARSTKFTPTRKLEGDRASPIPPTRAGEPERVYVMGKPYHHTPPLCQDPARRHRELRQRRPGRAGEHALHRRRRGRAPLGQQMPVPVRRRRDRLVPQRVLHGHEVQARRDHPRRRRVPQIVDPRRDRERLALEHRFDAVE
nr:MAG TPA: hypothetical protein [Caudoviricetes sp.]